MSSPPPPLVGHDDDTVLDAPPPPSSSTSATNVYTPIEAVPVESDVMTELEQTRKCFQSVATDKRVAQVATLAQRVAEDRINNAEGDGSSKLSYKLMSTKRLGDILPAKQS